MVRILIVDDEPRIRQMIREYLEHEGFSCTEATDGSAALAQLAATSFDLVLLDIMMPFVDGMTCLRELSLFMLLCTQGFILATTLDYFDEMGLYAFSSGINLILIVTILVCNTIVNKVTGASLDKGIGG